MAFRAFAIEIFRAKGVVAYNAQVLRYQHPSCTSHWQKKWKSQPQAFPWAASEFVYHEVCAVKTNEHSWGLYDPTDGYWIESESMNGHNDHFAVRIDSPEINGWSGIELGGYQWNNI